MLESAFPIASVWRHSPLLASQILTVRSPDADASRAESPVKATELTGPLWPFSIWRLATARIPGLDCAVPRRRSRPVKTEQEFHAEIEDYWASAQNIQEETKAVGQVQVTPPAAE